MCARPVPTPVGAARAGDEPPLRAFEAGGKWLLMYHAAGPLGGRLACLRCDAVASQPDLIEHGIACPYRAAAGRDRSGA